MLDSIRSPALWLSTALWFLMLSCDGGSRHPTSRPDSVPPPPDAGAPGCASGEVRLPDGRCVPAGLPLDMPCAPGELALPDGRCQPAGVPPEACGAGFLPDGQGGCEAILPEQVCPPGQMAVPGEMACRQVAPCGDGAFGEIPVDGTTEFVDQAYPGNDSDGSRERPWKTIGEGVRAATPGGIVAVAEGRYVEDVVVSGKPVRLWGRCPARVQVEGVGTQDAAVTIRASGSELYRLAITGPRFGLRVSGASSVTVEGVWVHEAGDVGMVLSDAPGVGVRASLIEQNRRAGVLVDGSDATIESSVVRATQPDGAGRFGRGLIVQWAPATGKRAAAVLRASLIEQNHNTGVFIEGSDATIESSVVRATQPNSAGELGEGVHLQADAVTGERAAVVLRASLIDQNHNSGVVVKGSEVTIESSVVRATQANGAGEFGDGIIVVPDPSTGKGGAVLLRASLIDQNHSVGVFIAGSEATIESSIVRATQSDGAGKFGRGIDVQADATTGGRGAVAFRGSLIEQNHDIGVFVEGSDATIESSVVRATQPNGSGKFGRGIGVQADAATGERAAAVLRASLIEQNHDVGVFVAGSDATIESSVVLATRASPSDTPLGDGLTVLDERGQSTVTIANSGFLDNARAGLLFVGSTGDITGAWSSGNRFGLVLQGEVQPTLGEGNSFDGNTEQGKVIDGDLALPELTPPPT